MTYQPGELSAVDYVAGKERGKYVLKTAGKTAALDVTQDKDVLGANGQDLCYLNITLCDEKGNRNQQDEKKIYVHVEGEGTLQGLGSSNPSNEEDYFAEGCTTFDGDAMACIRAGAKAGEIKVVIGADGCEDVVRKIMVR